MRVCVCVCAIFWRKMYTLLFPVFHIFSFPN